MDESKDQTANVIPAEKPKRILPWDLKTRPSSKYNLLDHFFDLVPAASRSVRNKFCSQGGGATIDFSVEIPFLQRRQRKRPTCLPLFVASFQQPESKLQGLIVYRQSTYKMINLAIYPH